MYYIQPPAPEEHVDLHFICLVHKDGHLYELGEDISMGETMYFTLSFLIGSYQVKSTYPLYMYVDGRKDCPINHGATSPEKFIVVSKKYSRKKSSG